MPFMSPSLMLVSISNRCVLTHSFGLYLSAVVYAECSPEHHYLGRSGSERTAAIDSCQSPAMPADLPNYDLRRSAISSR